MIDWANNPPEGFDWDPQKYAETFRDHGVRLETAILVFGDPFRIEDLDDRDDHSEDRFFTVGLVWGEVLRVAFTLRGSRTKPPVSSLPSKLRSTIDEPMSETARTDDVRRRALERLSRSRSAREKAAAAHALTMGTIRNVESEAGSTPASVMTPIETKVLDVAREILMTKGAEGKSLALRIEHFVRADGLGSSEPAGRTSGSPSGRRHD